MDMQPSIIVPDNVAAGDIPQWDPAQNALVVRPMPARTTPPPPPAPAPPALRIAWSAVPSYTDTTGKAWSNTNNGTISARAYFDRSPAHGTTDPALFAREVSGVTRYVSPPVPAGVYTVRTFHIEEFWTTPGAHVFSITINGAPFVTGLDMFATAGTLTAIERHTTVTLAAAGTITLAFTAAAAEGELVAVEILAGVAGGSRLVTAGAAPAPTPKPSGGASPAPGSGGTGGGAQPGMARVSKSGSQLLLSGARYRFTGFNFPWLYGCGADAGWTATDAQIVDFLGRLRPTYSVVRVMHTNRSADLSRFDWFLTQCKARGVRVIPCFTDMLGGCGDPDGDYNAHQTWISSGAYNGAFKIFVQRFVARYRGEPGILMHELINEVDKGAGVAATRTFYDTIGGAIHAVDPEALVGTGMHGEWAWGSADYRTVTDSPGIDCTGDHDYNLFKGGAMVSPIMNAHTALSTGKPFYLGETGPNLNDNDGPYSWPFQSTGLYATWLSARWTATFTAYPTLAGICDWDWAGNKDRWPREDAVRTLVIPGVGV
jgi:hypothetical protein